MILLNGTPGNLPLVVVVRIDVVVLNVSNFSGVVSVVVGKFAPTHLTEHRVPGTNTQVDPNLSKHFILGPHSLDSSLGHISSGVVGLMHLKEH